uniref:Uncharacterized protein n=1 Tax=Aegilops tauschii subsp. strangulata TaxID=200361 RepID=A0A453SJF6_AEGTS
MIWASHLIRGNLGCPIEYLCNNRARHKSSLHKNITDWTASIMWITMGGRELTIH